MIKEMKERKKNKNKKKIKKKIPELMLSTLGIWWYGWDHGLV